jgi:beta-1,4-mannosyltransferase
MGRAYWVVVLGDFGRSPRMQFHTLSLAHAAPAAEVHVVAYAGSAPLAGIREASNVRLHWIPEPPALLRQLPRILLLIFKVLHQLAWLLWTMLVTLPSPSYILMQNPPAIPTMAVCWLAAARHRAQFIIDWHNYGYTILALSQGPRHPLVRVARAYERFWGRKASGGFCVTSAMQQDLATGWGITATVLYDRPPTFFQRTPLPAAHTLFRKLGPALEQPELDDALARRTARDAAQRSQEVSELTALTAKRPGQAPQLRPDRPAVVVSSTSWTADEDFGILLDAAVHYDRMACEAASRGSGVEAGPSASGSVGRLPDLLLLITGRGPQRAHYLEVKTCLGACHSAASAPHLLQQ